MAGFQFTPDGIIPLGAPAPNLGENVSGATAHVGRPEVPHAPEAAQSLRAPAPSQAHGLDASAPLTGKQLAQVARARIKVLDRLLRSVPALEEERASLKRLVAAAGSGRKKRDGKLQ